jgi:hypothetical protein
MVMIMVMVMMIVIAVMVMMYRSAANALLVCLEHLQQLKANPHPLLL